MNYVSIKYMSPTLDDTLMPLHLYAPYPLKVFENNYDNIGVVYQDVDGKHHSYWFDKKYIDTYI